MPHRITLKERERRLLERVKGSDGVPYPTLEAWAQEAGVTDVAQFTLRHLEKGLIRTDGASESQPELIKPTKLAWQ